VVEKNKCLALGNMAFLLILFHRPMLIWPEQSLRGRLAGSFGLQTMIQSIVVGAWLTLEGAASASLTVSRVSRAGLGHWPYKRQEERIMLQDWTYRLLFFVMSIVVSVGAGNLLAAETPTKPAPSQTPGGDKKPSAEGAIRQSLTKNVSLWYHEVPLPQVAEDLESKLGVPVRLDIVALEDAGVDDDSLLTFNISNVSARAAISLMLRKLQLTTITAH